MKKRFALFLTLVMILTAATALAGIPKTPSEFSYVIDETNTLSQEQKDVITDYGEALLQATGGKDKGDEVVALIVEFLDGMDSNEYATKVINEWGLGDNSMLILLATGDRAVEIGAGKGLDRLVSASARGELIDKNLDYFADSDFDDGMVALYKDVVQRDASVRGKTLSVAEESAAAAAGTTESAFSDSFFDNDEDDNLALGVFVVFAVILLVIFVLGVRWAFFSPRSSRGGYYGRPRPPRPPYGPMDDGFGGPRPRRGGLFGGSYSRPSGPQNFGGPTGSSRPSAPSSRPSSGSGRTFGGLFGGSSSGHSSFGHSSHSSSGSFGRSGGSRGSGAGRRF